MKENIAIILSIVVPLAVYMKYRFDRLQTNLRFPQLERLEKQLEKEAEEAEEKRIQDAMDEMRENRPW